MKSIFRILALTTALLAAVSCKMDFLYIPLPNTSWTYGEGDQRIFVHFGTGERATVLQRNSATGSVQVLNGTYTANGHAVDFTSDEGTTNRLIRTFSHLKTSKNKNYSRFNPEAYDNVDHTIWATIIKDNLFIDFLAPDGAYTHFLFKNVRHEEGVPYGWSKEKGTYQHIGSQVLIEEDSGLLFPEVMLKNEAWRMHFPVNEDKGKSILQGTSWTYDTFSYPGIIIFDTNSSFTRILVASRNQFQTMRGTYSYDGATITMDLDGKKEVCIVAENKFTFLERTYTLFD